MRGFASSCRTFIEGSPYRIVRAFLCPIILISLFYLFFQFAHRVLIDNIILILGKILLGSEKVVSQHPLDFYFLSRK